MAKGRAEPQVLGPDVLVFVDRLGNFIARFGLLLCLHADHKRQLLDGWQLNLKLLDVKGRPLVHIATTVLIASLLTTLA